ncbi:hypothetical protein ACFQ3Z_09095 [Streptomyces nogalater]
MTHASLANLMHWHHKTYGTRPQDRSTLLASPGFDVSVQDIWFTLTAAPRWWCRPPRCAPRRPRSPPGWPTSRSP